MQHHDWTFEYSDDHSVWRRGCEQRDALRAVLKTHPEYKEMYDEYRAFAFGETQIRPKSPK
jgi:hypothetical protein